MGVHGLWELLMPAGRRVDVGHVSRKIVAVDVSIWLTQFVRAMRDAEGAMVRNAHLLGVLRRCFKLLYLGVRPIFVFDGGTPALKRRTLMIRRSQRDGQAAKLRRLAEKMLMNRLKSHAIRSRISRANSGTDNPQVRENLSSSRKVIESEPAVYVTTDDISSSGMERFLNSAAEATQKYENVSTPLPSEPHDDRGNQKTMISRSEVEDIRAADSNMQMNTMQEENYFNDEDDASSGLSAIALPSDLQNIDDSTLVNLPAAMQAEVFKQIRTQQRARHRERVLGMQRNPEMFSQAQIIGFMKNAALNRRISRVRNTINIQTGATRRIASDNSREYFFEEDDCDVEPSMDGDWESRMNLAKVVPWNEVDSRRKLSSNCENEHHTAPSESTGEHDDDDILRQIRRTNELSRPSKFPAKDNVCGRENSITDRQPIDSGVSWAARVLDNAGTFDFGAGADLATGLGSAARTEEDSRKTTTARLRLLQNSFRDSLSEEEEDIREEHSLDDTAEQDQKNHALQGKNVTVEEFSEDDVEWEDCEDLCSQSVHVGMTPMQPDRHNSRSQEDHNCGIAKTAVPSTRLLENTLQVLRSRYRSCSESAAGKSRLDIPDNQYLHDLSTGENIDAEQKADCNNVNANCGIYPQLRHRGRSIEELEENQRKNIGARRLESVSSAPEGKTAESVLDADMSNAASRGKNDSLLRRSDASNYGCNEPVARDEDNTTATSAFVDFESAREDLQNPGLRIATSMALRNSDGHDVVESTASSRCGDALENLEVQRAIEESVGDSTKLAVTPAREQRDVFEDGKERTGNGKQNISVPAQREEDRATDVDTQQDVAVNSSPSAEHSLLARDSFSDNITENDPMFDEYSNRYSEEYHGANADELIAKANALEAGEDASETEQLSNEDIDRLRAELGVEKDNLTRQSRDLQGSTESLSDEMYGETRDLLRLLGLPYLEAPMEAEAQCAYLNQVGLVDAVLTEDSDALLFGATTVYRNLFVGGKFAESYDVKCIETELGISREQLVHLALLLGSDYTQGVRGVGIVNSMEILHAFPGRNGLHEFKEWARLTGVLDEEPQAAEISGENADAVRRRFCWKHKNMKRNWEIHESFPNDAVVDAYMRPEVDKSRVPFKWHSIDVEGLAKFCWDKFGWGIEKFSETTKPVLSQIANYKNEQSHQGIIEDYFKPHRFARIRSERLQEAVKGLAGENAAPLLAGPRDKSKAVAGNKRKRYPVAQKRTRLANDIMEGSDDDCNAVERIEGE